MTSTYHLTPEQVIETRVFVASLYKDEKGDPIILTDGQCNLFDLIFKKRFPRNHVCTITRYGKSLTIALAVLTRVAIYPEKWAIAAGNDKQAGIIMAYIIQHIFDNPMIQSRFVMERAESEENIRRYRNKDRINFKLEDQTLGEVFITNAKGAMGFGAPNVIGDESALIPDKEEVLIHRMLGDQVENFYCKVGNPWDSGHFRASAEDPAYHKLIIDWHEALKENRITEAYVEEMRKKPFFDVLYECKFPPLDQMDDQGWMPLLTKEDVDKAVVRVRDTMGPEVQGFGVNKLGGDVAGGGKNFSLLVQRFTNLARILIKTNDPDTMNFAESIINIKKREGTYSEDINIDKVGVGKGVFDITARELDGVRGINAGDKLPKDSMEESIYFNVRAKMYWLTREWILKGGKLLIEEGEDLDNTWYQLTKIKYRKKLEGTRGKIQIMPKENMLKLGIQSPDVADGLALTFATPDIVRGYADMGSYDEPYDRYGLFPKV